MIQRALIAISFILTLTTPVFAGPFSGLARDDGPASLPPVARAADLDEQLGKQLDLSGTFRDQSGAAAPLAQQFADGKPVILVLSYYRCPMLCGLVLRGLVKGLRELTWTVGDRYRVVTVSFDPHDGPAEAAKKRVSAIEALGGAQDLTTWPFLVGGDEAVGKLTHDLGFRYARDPRTGEFAHPAAIVVLTPGGVVSRYLYGVDFSARDLRLALLDASRGQVGSIIDRVLMTCYRFDPATHKYAAFILGFIRIGGALILLTVSVFVALLYRHERTRVTRSRAAT